MGQGILIQDEEDLIEIRFDDVEKYHGQSAIAGAAIAFKALQAAFSELFPLAPPKREEIAVTSGHPGPGVRDAMEMVTRAVTRGGYTVDTLRPKGRWNPYRDLSFSFLIEAADGRRAEVVLKEGVLPRRFFELLDFVRRAAATQEEKRELRELKRALADQLLSRPASELFTIEATSTARESPIGMT